METSAHGTREPQDLLLRESEEFQQLFELHRELDNHLKVLTQKLFLSEQEKVEEVMLKKKKLAIKDQMAIMIRSH
jgi:uncharacterized protein YdcH (DUF465 family)